MGAVHLLPGTTFSDIDQRGDYASEARAAMTLDELERWLALEITRYHAERHAGIGLPPRRPGTKLSPGPPFRCAIPTIPRRS